MELIVPGDKSISQRGLMMAVLARGRSRLRGMLTGHDPHSTAAVLRGLGARVPPLNAHEVVVEGCGLRGLRSSDVALDCGNSGTCARLMMGVLSGQPGHSALTGDASLRIRPMARVIEPLRDMGSHIEELAEEGRLPVRIEGSGLRASSVDTRVASAQVKSALLLASLTGGVPVTVSEPGRSRDHTERLFRAVGAHVEDGRRAGRWVVTLSDPPDAIDALDLLVPADISSAAFLLVFASLGGSGPETSFPNVGLNPTRCGLLPALHRMGAAVDVEEESPDVGVGEPSGTLVVRPTPLRGIDVEPSEIPGLIDEIPILAVAASRATGTTRITGAAELRVKETDRIHALVSNLRAVGVEVEELADGLEIEGSDRPLTGAVRSFDDHRIAMAFGVLGALPGNRIEIDDPDVADVSFPGFWALLARAARGG